MKQLIIAITITVLSSLIALGLYAVDGWRDAASDAPALKLRAASLIQDGYGAAGLGAGRFEQLIAIEDPTFYTHNGTDGQTAGAGLTTLTQSLSKRLAFKNFKPGLPKIRQTAYARSLERHLTKDEIAALWLETVSIGRVEGEWITGFHAGARAVYDKPAANLSDDEFLTLVAVLLAPQTLHAEAPDARLNERVARIKRKLAGDCAPAKVKDVWLEACATPAKTPPI